MGADALAQVLRPFQTLFDPASHPDLLLGLSQPDDAAVYRLDGERALVVTTDFFTPIVDDPVAYGAIAAANALSDVYATGGRPLLALTILALPADLPPDVTSAILLGLGQKVRESGAVVAGGHTVQDKEPKVGLAAVGIAHPERLLIKSAARPGDVLVLTKPIGTGCITTAAKRDQAEPAHVEEAVRWMTRLNREASEAALAAGGRAATDITGYGLLGHATEVARASHVSLRFHFDQIPLLDGARTCAEKLIFPGGSKKNQSVYTPGVRFDGPFTSPDTLLLFDAQTSGGLLIALSGEQLGRFGDEMSRAGHSWWRVGEVLEPGECEIFVTR